MAEFHPYSGGSHEDRALSPEQFFDELLLSSELRLAEAIDRDTLDERTRWTVRSYDDRTGLELNWFRLSDAQGIGQDYDADTLDVGVPTLRLPEQDLNKQVEELAVPEQTDEERAQDDEFNEMVAMLAKSFILIEAKAYRPQLGARPEQKEFRLTVNNAKRLAEVDAERDSAVVGLLGKLSTYHLHPIRITI